MVPFEEIREIAEKRKGGAEILESVLPPVPDDEALARIPDARVLAEMSKRIFSAGFVWRVIEVKWPGFEEAFHDFAPERLIFEPDDYWDALAKDKRIVRNALKIAAVRHNAQFVREISREHGGFGRFLADWPSCDLVGLLDVLAKRGSRLGGMTGQYFLRFIGKDGFIASKDVVACLRSTGVEIASQATSKRDLRKVQERFNAWTEETGLSLAHLSRICAMSIGRNYDVEQLRERGVTAT